MFREYGRRWMPWFSQQSETCFQSEPSPAGTSLLFIPSFLPHRLPFPLAFAHPLLQTRLDEDRLAFINHPLKRNPWRSIINDLATNFEEVPRPNENWPAECILHFEIRVRLTRNRRPDSLTLIFFICYEHFVMVHLRTAL